MPSAAAPVARDLGTNAPARPDLAAAYGVARAPARSRGETSAAFRPAWLALRCRTKADRGCLYQAARAAPAARPAAARAKPGLAQPGSSGWSAAAQGRPIAA